VKEFLTDGVRCGDQETELGVLTQRPQNALDHDGGSVIAAEEVNGDPGGLPAGPCHLERGQELRPR
jgi:hypothetical protein